MEPKEKYLMLLKEQLEKLNAKPFDLASWKKSTSLILANLYGSDDTRLKAISSIDYEYTSWSLRNESGTLDPVKVVCKETLQTIIRELEMSEGTTQKVVQSSSTDFSFIWEAFEDELTGSKSKSLKKILTEEQNPDMKTAEIDIILQELPDDTKRNILKKILLSKSLNQWLSKE